MSAETEKPPQDLESSTRTGSPRAASASAAQPASPKQPKKEDSSESSATNKKVHCETSWWNSSRKHKHRVITWSPINSKKEIKALIAINHGLGEHIYRYDYLATHFAEKGYIVFGLDHEGHGASEGSPNMLLSNIIDDACEFHAFQFEKYFNVKSRFLLGHSMGALISIHCCLKFPDRYNQGVVLSAPPLSIPMARPVYWVGKILAAIAPNSQIIALDIATLSRDPEVVKAYNNDPLVWHHPPPTGFGLDLLQSAISAFGKAKEFKTPCLLMAGSKDSMIENAKIPEFHSLIASQDKTCIIWEGFYHEILNEPEKSLVVDQVYKWVKARLVKKFDQANPTQIATVSNGKLTLQSKL